MVGLSRLQKLANEHGTPLFVVDHDELRRNYATFKKYLPRVQAYYAVKANPDPEIVRTLFKVGSSFDVASLPELRVVCENIKDLPAKKRQQWIWDKIIYANPIKANETLAELDHYNPLVTYDNAEEIRKIKVRAPCRSGPAAEGGKHRRHGRTLLEIRRRARGGGGPDPRSRQGRLVVEGLSFHVGSQTTNFKNYVQAINLGANIFKEAGTAGTKR